jgi:type VI secretion system secreted protein Hcp
VSRPAEADQRLAELEALVRVQGQEIERLRAAAAADEERLSRRGLVKGLGLGSLVALGAAGAGLGGGGSVLASPGGVVENSDLAGELPATLLLEANGTIVSGEGTRLGGPDTIEVIYFRDKVETPIAAASGQSTGRRTYSPIIFRKRIDKSTPLLAKALANNEVIEAKFQFWEPTTPAPHNFFTIEFSEGRIVSIERVLPETIRTGTEATIRPIEEVGVTFQTITWTILPDGVEFTDSWRQRT